MSAAPLTATDEPQTFHVFDCRPCARRFRGVSGEDNIIEGSIGWQDGPLLPENATCYLWPLRDASGRKWIKDVAATTKAKLRLPPIPEPHRDIGEWIRAGATADELVKAMVSAGTVENTNDRTERDVLTGLPKEAAALTGKDLYKSFTDSESKVRASRSKYPDDPDDASSASVSVVPVKPIPSQPAYKSADEARPPKSGGELQGSAVICPDVEPWPEAVNGAEVLNDVASAIRRYVALPDGAADMIALWCAHAHCFQQFQCSPRLNIYAPEKDCGKTTLRDVVSVFVPRALCLENMTEAVAFRLVDKYSPTLLADEYDGWLKDNEGLRSLLNSGHRRGGMVPRCEGDKNEVRLFKCYAPAVLCGIGALPGTLHDRSIVVRLTRAKQGEVQARFDSRHTAKEKELCRKLARFCADNREKLATIDPKLPDGVFNRLADNWRPLFTIAEAVGGDWPKRCAESLSKLTGRDVETESLRVMLLADIQPMVQKAIENGSEWLASIDIIDTLLANPERPWNEVNRGKPINERWLARRLDPIKPDRFRDDEGTQTRGYKVAEIQDAIERFIHPPVLCGQVSHMMEKGDSTSVTASVTEEAPQASQNI